MSARGVLRTVKNYTKGYTPIQMKVREATSNDPGGPSGALMNEIAQATYNQTDFLGVMEIIDKRLNDKGKNWRHVFKALTVFDYCLHVGSVNVVQYAIDNIYIVKTLREFQYIDDSGRDQGANVRHKAKELTALLLDRSKLEEQRKNRNWMNNRLGFGNMGGNMGMGGGNFYGNTAYSGSSGRLPSHRGRPERAGGGGHMRTNSLTSPDNRYGDDDGEMRQALAESRRSAASKRVPKGYDEEAELKRAIEESAREAKAEEDKKEKSTGGGAAEVDLLGGFDDAFSTAGAGSSVNNVNAMGSVTNVGNMGMMSSTSSFMQQQQQFGNTGSAANDLFDAFGGAAGAGMNNGGFDPFGLNSGGGMNQGGMNQGMVNQGGMGMDMNTGMGTGMNPGMGMTSTNPYDTSMFGNSSNQFVSQTTMTTTSMTLSGVGGGAGSSTFGQDMSGAFGQGMGGAFGQAGGASGNNLLTGTGSAFDSGLATSSAAATTDLLGGTSAMGGFDGASGAFGSAFDGGMAAKTLPFGVNPNDPNSKIAEIARNSDRIDPFASLAASGTASSNPFGGTSTAAASSNNLLGGAPFSSGSMMMASTPALSATPGLQPSQSQQFGASGFSSGSGVLGAGSSLVDLSPAALATSNTASGQSFGQVNRNPFAAAGPPSTQGAGNMGKQMSLNQMMGGVGFSQASTPMGASVNAFDQQAGVGMNAFGSMQAQPMQAQQQQMVFQQQQQFSQQHQQQQQVNPFGQQQGASTTNTTNFFGL